MIQPTRENAPGFWGIFHKPLEVIQNLLWTIPENEGSSVDIDEGRRANRIFVSSRSESIEGSPVPSKKRSASSLDSSESSRESSPKLTRTAQTRLRINAPIHATFINADQPRTDSLFTKEGQVIKRTRTSAIRLQLEGTEGEPFQMDVLAGPQEIEPAVGQKMVGLDNGIATCVVKSGEKYYLVKIDTAEIAQRLLISKEKIDNAALEGSLGRLFYQKRKKLENLPNLLQDYERLFERHFAHNPPDTRIGTMVNKEGQVIAEGLDARQMMKIVRTFHRTEVSGLTKRKGHLLSFENVKEKYGLSSVSVLARREGGELKLTRADAFKELGEGGFGTAFRIMQLDTNKLMAGKRSHVYLNPLTTQKARKDLQNEFRLLRELEGAEGIQDPPHVIFLISGDPTEYIMVGNLYEGNVHDLIESDEYRKADMATKLDCCRQVLKGGKHLIDHQILHVDQKTANCFFETVLENGRKRYLIKIADLGGARKFDEIVDNTRLVHTAENTARHDAEHGFSAKSSVYQQGDILFELLTNGRAPWMHVDAEDYPLPDQFNEKDLLDNGVPEGLRQLIRSMCDPLPENRPTADEALARFEALTTSPQRPSKKGLRKH